MKSNVIHEIMPLAPGDCFGVYSGAKPRFDSPLHYHEGYELNLIMNAGGAKRIIGSHLETISDIELVLLAPNVTHTWISYKCQNKAASEITVQFHQDLFDDKFLSRNQLSFVKSMLERAQRGILFSQDTAAAMRDRIIGLNNKSGFISVMELLCILHDLSTSANIRTLSDAGFSNTYHHYNSRRLERVFDYINLHYNKQVNLGEVSKIANMPESSFSRFIKQRTGKTFVDNLNEIRLGHAARLLIETSNTVSEIAYQCGFNNISNFNRAFKRKKQCIPKYFRETYSGYSASA